MRKTHDELVTVTLSLPVETNQRLNEQAELHGLSVNEFIQQLFGAYMKASVRILGYTDFTEDEAQVFAELDQIHFDDKNKME